MTRFRIVRYAFSLLLLAGGSACSDDDNPSGDDGRISSPTAAVQRTFDGLYAGARSIQWHEQGPYQFAEFDLGGDDCDACFAKGGTWVLTRREQTRAQMPQAVLTAFASDPLYGGWRPDDYEIFSQNSLPDYWLVEASSGTADATLWYDETGELRRTVADDDRYGSDDRLPVAIARIVAAQFPNGVLFDIAWQAEGHCAVFLIDGNVLKELLFESGALTRVRWQIAVQALPDPVKAVLRQPAYADYTAEEAFYVEPAGGTAVYHVWLTRAGSAGMTVAITPEGAVQ